MRQPPVALVTPLKWEKQRDDVIYLLINHSTRIPRKREREGEHTNLYKTSEPVKQVGL